VKSLHIPFTFYPDPVGGTEVYAEALARHLQRGGAEAMVVAPGQRNETYRRDGLLVRRFAALTGTPTLECLYGEGDAQAAGMLGRILDKERPSVVHLHAFTPAVSVRVVREAKKRDIPVIFTYHTPTVSCQRGTLLRWGKEVCDGRLDVDLCARCTLNGLGLPRGLADLLGRMPIAAGQALAAAHLSGGIWTALRMRQIMSIRHAAVRALFVEVDHVVAVCNWIGDLLSRNGVPQWKISLCRQGLAQEVCQPLQGSKGRLPTANGHTASQLRLAFLGRMVPIKGAHLLIRAVRKVPHAPISLDLYSVVQSSCEAAYLRHLRRLAGTDRRIVFREPVAASSVVDCLKTYDLLAVPSQWLETGPLVVLEAFAAGIPVMGSDLGGIPELVRDGVNGLLVAADSEVAWAQRLREVCDDRDVIVRLRNGIPVPKGMSAVASEMNTLYHRLLGSG